MTNRLLLLPTAGGCCACLAPQHPLSMRQFILTCLVLVLSVAFVKAQTITTTDVNGNTIIEVVTTNAAGAPVTSVIQSIPNTATTSQTTPAVAAPSTTAPPTPIAVATPPPQQGPVGAPPPPAVSAGGVTPYTYTTVINGVTEALTDLFTPTNPATLPPSIGPSGTILDYSSWLAEFGPHTTSGSSSSAFRPDPFSAGWWGVFAGCAVSVLSMAWLLVM